MNRLIFLRNTFSAHFQFINRFHNSDIDQSGAQTSSQRSVQGSAAGSESQKCQLYEAVTRYDAHYYFYAVLTTDEYLLAIIASLKRSVAR